MGNGRMLAPKPELLVALESDRDAVAEFLSSNAPDSENFEDLEMARFLSTSSAGPQMPGLLHFDRGGSTTLDIEELKKDGFQTFDELVHRFHFDDLPPVPSGLARPDAGNGWQKDWFQLRLWMPLQGKKRLFVVEAGGVVADPRTDLTTLQEKGWISQAGQLVFFYNNFLEHAGVEAEDPPASGDNFRNVPNETEDFKGKLCTSASAWLSKASHASLLESCQRHIQKKEIEVEGQAKNNLNNTGEEEDQKPQTPQTKRQRIE